MNPIKYGIWYNGTSGWGPAAWCNKDGVRFEYNIVNNAYTALLDWIGSAPYYSNKDFYEVKEIEE